MKLFFTSLGLLLIAACNDQQSAPAADEHKAADQHEHNLPAESLRLNNGVKWKADSSTNNNVEALQAIVEQFTSTEKTLGTYKQLGTTLQSGLDKMISECRMKGPDHDALHKWLEPLIGQVKKLNETEKPEESAQHFSAITQQIQLYFQFFE
jgi:hypothetical protein